jgi:hypothetical protein
MCGNDGTFKGDGAGLLDKPRGIDAESEEAP